MFYLLAILVVAAALSAVVAPSTRLTLLGVIATDVLVGVLLVAAGAQLLGLLVIVLPSATLVVLALILRRAGYGALAGPLPPFIRGWPVVAAVSAGIAILLAWTANAGAEDSVSTSGRTALITLLHYRFPISLGVGLGLAVLSVGGALLIGRTGADERRLDQAAAQRRLREQRAETRRRQRADARAQRARGESL